MDSMQLEMIDAEVFYFPYFFSNDESDRLFESLLAEIEWKQDKTKMFGKPINIPRLTAWYGDVDKDYTYSGITQTTLPWTACLLTIKKRIEPVSGVTFNSVLLNRYRDGSDSVSWHSDDEPELGENPVIGSVSLGQTRRFQLKHKKDSTLRETIELSHGSLLVMRGQTQHHWLHQIPKSKKKMSERINLTFRVIR